MTRLSFFALAVSILAAGTVHASCPKPLIIDSDFGSFDDDPLAIGLANIFQLWGEAEILAIVISTDYNLAPPAVDAINTFYGNPDIPIAINKPLSNAVRMRARWIDQDFVLCTVLTESSKPNRRRRSSTPQSTATILLA